MKFAILNFDNKTLVDYCIDHGKLLLQKYNLRTIMVWHNMFDNVVYIKEKGHKFIIRYLRSKTI